MAYGVPKLATMNSEEIRAKFNQLAEQTPNPEIKLLITQLGELMFARLQHTTATHNAIAAAIDGLRAEFGELSVLLLSRLKDNERDQTEKIQAMINRIHTLSNRFMAVENKVDEGIELLDLRLEALLEQLTNDGTK